MYDIYLIYNIYIYIKCKWFLIQYKCISVVAIVLNGNKETHF